MRSTFLFAVAIVLQSLFFSNSFAQTHPQCEKNPLIIMMDTMMTTMSNAPMSGNIERDFLLQMIPHHEGALAMAEYELKYGNDPEMRTLAQSIIDGQAKELKMMHEMLKKYPAKGEPNKKYNEMMAKVMKTMMMNTPKEDELSTDVDCNFARFMKPHHAAAVGMASVLLDFKPKGHLYDFAKSIIAVQDAQIDTMSNFIQKNCQ